MNFPPQCADAHRRGKPIGTCTVSIAHLHRDGFQFTIIDEGPSIPDREREQICKPFHRIDVEHPQPGLGIRLALGAEFVRAHNGDVHARRCDIGARLVVEIFGTSA